MFARCRFGRSFKKEPTMRSHCPIFWVIVSLLLMGCNLQESGNDRSEEQAGIPEHETESSPAVRPDDRERLGQGRRLGRGKMKGERGRGRFRNVKISKDEKAAVEIETVKVSYRTLQSIHTAMGKVLAPRTRMAIVTYPFTARIAEIHVGIGDWVVKDQKLLTLQSEEVGAVKSEFFKGEADLELARTNYAREKRLFDHGVSAQKNLFAAEAGLKVAQATLNAIEKKLHVLGFTEEEVLSLSETHQVNPVVSVYAPIEGKIIKHQAVLGAMIDQSKELLTIMDPRLLWIDAEIFERDISKIRSGQRVNISVPAFPGQSFTGRISYISDVLNEETRTITIRTEVENSNLKLKPGMFADIEILLNHKANVLVLPSEAILDDGNDQIVFVKVMDEYVPKVVKLGVKEDGFREVLEGIEEGDEVVTRGNFQLKSKLYEEALESQTH
jgi:cobalt-zinc-cadmium efflux system membrane fusion protein